MTTKYTAEMTTAERERAAALWERPTFKALESNPVVAATRRAMTRTNWRVGWSPKAGRIVVHLTAYRIGRNGQPTGPGQVRDLTACDTPAEAVAYIDALQAPA